MINAKSVYSPEKLKFFKQLFVAVKDQHVENKFPMGYMTYLDKEDASFKSRKATAVRWSGKEGTTAFYDNTPIPNFKVVSSSTRYATSNKVVNIFDPRGFLLEISVPNLVELLQTTTVKDGYIQEPCLWFRESGSNVLLPETHPCFQEVQTQKTRQIKELEPGEIIYGNMDNKYVSFYLGKFKLHARKKYSKRTSYSGYWNTPNVDHEKWPKEILTEDIVTAPGYFHIIASRHVDTHNDPSGNTIKYDFTVVRSKIIEKTFGNIKDKHKSVFDKIYKDFTTNVNELNISYKPFSSHKSLERPEDYVTGYTYSNNTSYQESSYKLPTIASIEKEPSDTLKTKLEQYELKTKDK